MFRNITQMQPYDPYYKTNLLFTDKANFNLTFNKLHIMIHQLLNWPLTHHMLLKVPGQKNNGGIAFS